MAAILIRLDQVIYCFTGMLSIISVFDLPPQHMVQIIFFLTYCFIVKITELLSGEFV